MVPRSLAKSYVEGKVVNERGEQLDYVDYLLELEYAKTPSTLIQYPDNPQEQADIAYYDELGKSLAGNVKPGVPIGKQVV